MIRGLFFDLDGTLVNTHEANFLAYKRAFAENGIDLTRDAFKQTIGMQAREFIPLIADVTEEGVISSIMLQKATYYKEYMHMSERNEPLIEFIQYTKVNHTIALVTSAKRSNATTVINHHRLEDLFDIVVCAEDVKQPKPNPEAYLNALAAAGLKAHEVVAFEDSDSGIKAAESAGISVIKINDYTL